MKMLFESFWGIVPLLVTAYFHLCKAGALLPLDAVTLAGLRVNSLGMVSVDIVINNASVVPFKGLEAVLSFPEGNLTIISLPSATRLYTVDGLKQDINYCLHLQDNSTIISMNYPLVTTGLMSIRVNPGLSDVEIVCEFLHGSRADGCQLDWRTINQSNMEPIESFTLNRENMDSVNRTMLFQRLIPGTSYLVHGFGLQGGNKLHPFPILLQKGFVTIPTALTEATNSATSAAVANSQSSNASVTLLVTILSVVLGSIVITIIILVCLILALIKCPRKSHTKSDKVEQGTPGDEDNIQTSANICYEGLLEGRNTLNGCQVDNESLHLYDDVLILTKPSTDCDYENVDPTTGFATTPKPFTSSQERSLVSPGSTGYSERACLPLKAIKPAILPKPEILRQQTKVKKDQRRACTFKHVKQSSSQKDFKRGTVSVILKAADYEIPARKIKTLPK